jgi:steroid delta-isomerase-like uncharacterized protein
MRIGELAKRAGVSVQTIRLLLTIPHGRGADHWHDAARGLLDARIPQETAMKNNRLLETSKQPFWRSYRCQGTGAVALCIGLCIFLIPSHAAGDKLQDQNKAVARAAFFDYLNHRDFKRFEEIHTKDFVKHYNNSPAENLSEEMEDAKGQFESSSDLTFTENWMLAEGDKVAVCFTAKGTHDGPFQGVPATGKHYVLSAMTVWRFVDGKIAEEWVFSNDLDLYRQLGLFKEPG